MDPKLSKLMRDIGAVLDRPEYGDIPAKSAIHAMLTVAMIYCDTGNVSRGRALACFVAMLKPEQRRVFDEGVALTTVVALEEAGGA